MRKKNSLKNVIASISSNILTILIGLIAQAIFIKLLGTEYLGLNNLFANVISMLSIVEMGIGSAIIYNLYKPIADNDTEKIKSLMQFYKKSYNMIALFVFIIGLIIIPLIPFIVDLESVTVDINIYIVYTLFLIETVCSYLLSYKRSILFADQKNYIINKIHMGYTVILNVVQLFGLYLTKNYYLYLIIKIVMRILENLVITIVTNQKYKFLLDKNYEKIDQSTQKDILKKVKALFFHKIGSFIVLGTDNIIISKFLGLVSVGLYSNYYLIINAVHTILKQIISATTASVGNLLVTETQQKQFYIFDKIRFLNFWFATFTSCSLLIIMQSFIKIWIGDEFLLSNFVLIVLVINYFLTAMRSTYGVFKDAAGIYYEDRFVPFIESIINIFASLLFTKWFGLGGVFIGTIISGLILWCYSYPKFVYKNLFGRTYKSYFKETLIYILNFIIILTISYAISNIFVIKNLYIDFIVNVIVALIVPNLLLLILYFKNDSFIYYKNMVLKNIKTKIKSR